MTQALIGVLALVVGIAIGYAVRTRLAVGRLADAERQAERILSDAESVAESQLKEAKVGGTGGAAAPACGAGADPQRPPF